MRRAKLSWLQSITSTLGITWQRVLCAVANSRRRLFRKRLPDYVVMLLDQEIAERTPDAPWWYGYIPGVTAPLSLESLSQALQRIAGDPDVKGVVFLVKGADIRLAQAQSLTALFDRFRQWDRQYYPERPAKQVSVFLEEVNTPGFVVASAADKAMMAPLSTWEVLGLRATPTYLKDSLARVGVQMEVVKIAPWKTAADAVSRASMSAEEREQYNWLLDSLFDDIVAAIAQGRCLPVERVQALIDGAPLNAQQAKEAGLIDAIVYEDELPRFLGDGEKAARLQPYARVRKLLLRHPRRRQAKAVGVISLMGAIVVGESRSSPIPLPILGDHVMGSHSVEQQIRAARDDDSLAAVVVHVDSRGGSALASDLIWRELDLLDQEKPVVIYMGNVAASGGYYIATPARKIVAQSATITGSIGVITAKPVTKDAFARFGAHRESVQRGENAGLYHDDSAWSAAQQAKMEESVRHIYHTFKQRVAEGRKLEMDNLDAICNGRVWTGKQALGHGLIDQVGDFQTAFDLACQTANLPTDGSVSPMNVTGPRRPLLAKPVEAAAAWLGLDALRQMKRLAATAMSGDWDEIIGRERFWLIADGLPKID